MMYNFILPLKKTEQKLLFILFFIPLFVFDSCKKNTADDVIIPTPTPDTIESFLRTETTTPGNYRAIAYNKNYSVKWQKDLSGEYFQKPVLYKETLYLSSGNSLTAVSAVNGEKKWGLDNSFGYFGNLSIRNDTIYYNHFNNTTAFIEACNALTGELYWSVPFQDVYDYGWGSFIEGNTFYFISADPAIRSHVDAFDITTKQITWQRGINNSHGRLFSAGKSFGVINQVDFFGKEGDYYSFDKKNGQVNWSKTNVTLNSPDFYDNLIICNQPLVSYGDPGLVAFDMESGQTKWSRYPNLNIASKTIAGNTIFIAGYYDFNKPVFFCADLITGNVTWTRTIDSMYNSLLVFDNVVYANIEPYATVPPNASGTVSFDAKTGVMIDSVKIGPNLMILTSYGQLIN
ncbi:MAG: PQQ-binding-like beta-propeller repeat protein [Chitinophagaceae bacterium]